MQRVIIEATQQFTLMYPGTAADALAFVRDPERSLSRLRFLRDLQADAAGVRGELIVPLPVLGEVDLPFHSVLALTPDGAALTPQPLTGERAWVEVSGQAQVQAIGATAEAAFHFQFRAHLATPGAEGWGGAAFEKMVRAAASRTLERIAQELPQGIQGTMQGADGR